LKWFHRDLKSLSKTALDKLKSSLAANNFIQPFNVWQAAGTTVILDGHYRAKAMRLLEKEGYRIPDLLPANFIECSGTTQAAELVLLYSSVYAAATAEGIEHFAAIYDLDMRRLMMEMEIPDIDLAKLFGQDPVQDPERVPEMKPDDIPPIPEDPRTRKGDLYELGPHRLLCGSATDPEHALLLMNGEKAAMVFTDPPYGVSYEAACGKFDMIKGDDKTNDDLVNSLLLPSLKVAVQVTYPEAAFYIWHASSTRADFEYALKAAGLIERQYLIWAKPGFILGHSDYRWAHEPCFYAHKQDRTPAFYGDRSQSTVWRAALHPAGSSAATLASGLLLIDGSGGRLFLSPKAPKGKKVRTLRLAPGQQLQLEAGGKQNDLWEVGRDDTGDHPTQKPVELAARAIENSSLPGEIVWDGFLGSGTTLIAAEITGRRHGL
ncbi:MAG: site-specific DNA-methyltransferase, partial [Chitinivibrionia bacterium]|nr:site-specific DNA-methyltransferase [Chitinivibrionia bacterium]